MGEPYEFDVGEPISLPLTIILSIILGVYALSLLAMSIILFKRWHSRVISFRCPSLLLTSQIWGFVCSFLMAISLFLGKEDLCTLELIVHCTYFPICGIPYFLRLPDLVYNAQLNKLKILRVQGKDNWRFQFKKYLTTRNRFLIVLLALVFQTGLILLLKYTSNLPGDCSRTPIAVAVCHLLLYLLITGGLFFRLRNLRDPYFIRLEILINMIVFTPFFILFILFPFVPGVLPRSFDVRWLIFSESPMIFLVNMALPVWLSFERPQDLLRTLCGSGAQTDQGGKDEGNKTNQTIFVLNQTTDVFHAVLHDPILLESFTTFLISNWSVENVLFYRAVEDYRTGFSSKSTASKDHGAFLLREYLTPGAALEINITMKAKLEVAGKMKAGELTQDLFDQAQMEIFHLMKADSFEKWQKTEEFKVAIEQMIKVKNSKKPKTRTSMDLEEIRQQRLEMAINEEEVKF